MGTDIYLYAELNEAGGWKPVPDPVEAEPDPFEDENFDAGQLVPCEVLDLGRPYGLFSVLSGGGVGLLSANDQCPAISAPRGFPEDMNDLYKDYVAKEFDIGCGDYGASWLMLSELIDFDWDQKVSRFAYVEKQYAKLFRQNMPFPAEYPKEKRLFHGLFGEPPENTEKVHWCVSIAGYVGNSHKYLIRELERLGPKDLVRIIYWFNC